MSHGHIAVLKISQSEFSNDDMIGVLNMDEYLEKFDNKFKSVDYNNAYIDELMRLAPNYDSPVANILKKYDILNNLDNTIKVSRYDAETIINSYDQNYHILIKVILDFLIASSNFRSKSNITKLCEIVIQNFKDEYLGTTKSLLLHNTLFVIQLTVIKFPDYREVVKKMLYDWIINEGKNNICKISSLMYSMLCNKRLNNIFNVTEYYNIYITITNFVTKENALEIETCLTRYIDHFKTNDKNVFKNAIEEYVKFIVAYVDEFSYYQQQILLQNVRDYMDVLGSYNDSDYAFIDNKLVEANTNCLKNMHEFDFETPEEITKSILCYKEQQKVKFSSLSDVDRFNKLMMDMSPLQVKEINKTQRMEPLLNIVSNKHLDEDGRVINYKKLKDDEMFSLESGNYISLLVNLTLDVNISVFLSVFNKENTDFKDYIRLMLSNNELVDENNVEDLMILFDNFFGGEYLLSVSGILEYFEASLRYYLKNKGMNIYKRNGSRDLIGLSNIFNNNKNNTYRDELLKIIDEDYYFTFKWFLVDEYGFGLRDKLIHKVTSTPIYKSTYAVYIIFHIIRLYWFFQKK